MESPVSAFSVYKSSQKLKEKPFKKNRKQKQLKNTEVPEDLLKIVAKKLKESQKKAKDQNISKKKTLKKKKSKDTKKKVIKTTVLDKKRITKDATDSDDIPPQLFGPVRHLNSMEDVDDVKSHSSNGSFDFTPVQTNSIEEGHKAFNWMIAPYNVDEFLSRIWEKKPLHISRKKEQYYKEIISTPLIDNMLRTENILFTKNIDITSYTEGKRETHNPVGRAHPHVVWDFYLNGCSIRLLNPQTYLPKLHLLNATLQEFFNSFVGANAYLTPPDSQGFAPHYDDIEAFILQIEGKKHWKVYKPLEENEVLPRVSSKNYDQEEIGTPILEVTLEAGDMLYFPRGYIHQGVTIDGEHSLHITVSMYQKHSWADLFEKMIPAALQAAITQNVELRRGLPLDIYENFGIVNSDVNTPRKQELQEQIKTLIDRIKDYLPIDGAVDEMAKNYQHDALPPVLNDLEKAVTVYGDSDVMVENGKVTNRVEIGLDTRVRLLRKNILRMVMEDEVIRLYYHIENSLEYHGNEPQFLEISEDLAPAIETLITAYPEYVLVENLDIPKESDKLQVAIDLWERGLIMTEYPLDTIEDD